jgi:hypothetical protein
MIEAAECGEAECGRLLLPKKGLTLINERKIKTMIRNHFSSAKLEVEESNKKNT